MENLIPVLVILGIIGFILWKNKDKIVQIADKFTNREQPQEVDKPAPYKVPDPPISIAPIEVKPEVKPEPVLQPNVGLAGFRITPENAAILDARIREDQATGVHAGTYRNIYSLPQPLKAGMNGAGENFLVEISPSQITLDVIGPLRIDTIAAADSPARAGTFFHLHAQPESGVPIKGMDSANAASIVIPEGRHRVAMWSDEHAKAWIVFR